MSQVDHACRCVLALAAATLVACGGGRSSEPAATDAAGHPPVDTAVDEPLAEDSPALVDATPDDAEAPFAPAEYISGIVSHTVGPGGGSKEEQLPTVVLGPPHGAGCCGGSTDVFSLGEGGEIVVEFAHAIVDGPGVDLLVFENPFQVGGDPSNLYVELGEVSVSDDGVRWSVFPCFVASGPPYGSCAGWHPVYATAASGVNINDPAKAGGDPFDLADLGVKRARFVRVRDARSKVAACCKTAGFDLDAMAAIHWEP